MRLSGNELCEFSIEGDGGWLGEMKERQFVEHIGEPLAFLLPVDVESPYCIVQRLRAHRDLRGKRLLAEMLQRTANLEVLREVVLPVHSEHSLALL